MTEEQRHQAKYFINFFEAIPDERWCAGLQIAPDGQRCALGHLLPEDEKFDEDHGSNEKNEAVSRLFGGGYLTGGGYKVAAINDGRNRRYQQPTPKARILAALHDLIRQ